MRKIFELSLKSQNNTLKSKDFVFQNTFEVPFSISIYDLRKLYDQLELPNAFFDPITYLKAHNYLIYFLKYGESKINFKKLYALQYSYCEEHLSIYIIDKIQSLSSSSPLVIRFLAYKINDLIYSVIKKLKTSSV